VEVVLEVAIPASLAVAMWAKFPATSGSSGALVRGSSSAVIREIPLSSAHKVAQPMAPTEVYRRWVVWAGPVSMVAAAQVGWEECLVPKWDATNLG
jgi:hypothetical protein